MDVLEDLDPTMEKALEGAVPGRLVNVTSKVFPGAAATGRQIPEFADYWRALALEAIGQGSPALVALGDSLSQGIGASSPELGYVSLIRQRLIEAGAAPVPVLNLSRSGARIDDVLSVQLPALAASGVEPLVTVCTIGSNDLLRSLRIGQTTKQVRLLVQALPEGSILATVPAKGSGMAKVLNRSIQTEANDHGVAIADIGSALTSWRGRFAKDGFHPNDKGYRLWDREFASQLPASADSLPEGHN